MLERSAPVDEIFATFNNLLLKEWSREGTSDSKPAGVDASVAACAILIDSTAQTATVFSHGTPAPVYWHTDGNARLLGESGGFPLGWFPDFAAAGVVQPILEGGSFCLWTDGLQDVAEKKGVSELSLAFALQRAKARNEKLAAIDWATDDILVADIHLSAEHRAPDSFRPIILEQYQGGQTEEIDEFQAYWERSLVLAVPEMPEALLHDVLLCSREAVLNALKHGCAGQPAAAATFQNAYCSETRTIRVRVCDPGPGHHFDFQQTAMHDDQEFTKGHLGLMLIQHLASRAELQRGGATIIMEFTWAPEANGTNQLPNNI